MKKIRSIFEQFSYIGGKLRSVVLSRENWNCSSLFYKSSKIKLIETENQPWRRCFYFQHPSHSSESFTVDNEEENWSEGSFCFLNKNKSSKRYNCSYFTCWGLMIHADVSKFPISATNNHCRAHKTLIRFQVGKKYTLTFIILNFKVGYIKLPRK